ncbi:MAG: 4-hydroxy-tetrahydrodipicolinate synthase [Rectinemataceae bacterium]|nr:4-hydroxy-tetrahydrodipicolinate synthase [Spirochaetaceae bacterium]
MKLHGVFVVTVTPFTAEGKVDFFGIEKNVDWLIRQGVHGLIPLGSTGEFASLEDEDKKAIIDCVMGTVHGRVPVVVGATAETTEKAIRNALYAEKAGAAGVLVLPPYYYTPDQEEIYGHYRRIAEALSIPIMIYNNPGSSKVDILPETVARLSEVPGIEYIKESTGNIRRITEIRMSTEDSISIFCGWEDMAYESFIMGAQGWVCVLGNILPKETVELYELVAEKKDYQKGWDLYRRLLPWLRYLEYSGKAHKALKYVLDGMGLAGGYSSSPKRPLEAEDRAIIDRMMREMAQGL